MKIALLNTWVPFVRGGAEYLADALAAKLAEYGHEAVLIRIPFTWDPLSRITEHMLACRLMKLPEVDRVIAFKFPAYYVPHPRKVLWLLHQFRQAYDLYDEPGGLPHTAEGRDVRSRIIRADNSFLPECRSIFANSHVTADRLDRFNKLQATILYPPLLRHDHLSCTEYGDYVFVPGRINETKRQYLAVNSIQYCKSNAKLVIAGSPESTHDAERIRSIVRANRCQDKIHFIDRFISEEEKAELFNRALACIYIPYDEDSYGYVTLESYHSRKPVITCTDSGGIQLLVKDNLTGFVVNPTPEAIAAGIDRLFEDKALTRRMGEAGYDLVRSLNITWDRVMECLIK